jgi:hypothetical protein
LSEGIRIDTMTRVVQNREPVAVEVDRSVVMMSVEQGKYYGLEGVGGRIWKLLEEPRTVSELCAALQQEFDVDAEVCRADVVEFVTEMARERLLVIVDEKADPVRASSIG